VRATLTLMAMLQVGCAVLTTARRDYAAGDTVGLTLANHGVRTLSHDWCGVALERRTGERWAPLDDVGEPPECGYVAMLARVGKVIRDDEFRLPEGLAAGEYRVIFWIYWRAHRATVASNAFRVR
jgi:hypothetical protein